MSDGNAGYLAELAAALRESGLPEERIEATVADLATHLEQTGAEGPQEFGPAGEFAAQLAPPDGGTAAESPVETWRWTADTYADEALLNRFGAEGWEVERIDGLGRFVSRRDIERPLRWEYRRELVSLLGREGREHHEHREHREGRERLNDRLASDGWEACGTWLVYAWFKRPLSAAEGPGPGLPTPPPRPAPRRRTQFGRRFRRTLALTGVALVAVAVVVGLAKGDAASGPGFASGLLAGAVVPLVLMAVVSWRTEKARARRDSEAE
ncbi:HAAS signaling domain-containing protein [Streptomyces mesophilus]|uniref:HAAS signaling domain-containing protein n=1 Tax=Streptomyces mesophilus TaxID=1775132 RepID=UPI00331E00BA